MDKAVIKLPLGEYRAPTQQELNDGKAYVKRRNEVALALTSLIEGILLDILEEIFRLCRLHPRDKSPHQPSPTLLTDSALFHR